MQPKASTYVMVGMALEKMAPYEPGSVDVVWYGCDREMIANNKRP